MSRRFLLRSLAFLLAALMLALAGAYWYARSSLPRISGTVEVASLKAPVEVVRDRHGIPHLKAASWEDANFALGYAHAQDRLWQMEMSRRIAAGRLSEIFGESTVNSDRFMRTLSVYRLARENASTLDEGTRAIFQAYADGVNAYLQSREGALPPEFLLLQHQPEAWEIADSLAWMKMMAWDLSQSWRSELTRLRLSARLTPQQIAEFLAPYPGDATHLLPDLKGIYAGFADAAESLAELAPQEPEWAIGSNNWVIDGSRSTTGKPLLANDPHLGLTAPAVWYFAHLQAGDRPLIGATLPGVPMVVLGRNDRLAWGFTNTGPDVQDLFIEEVTDADGKAYRTPSGEAPFRFYPERLRIKGKPEIALKVRWSRHGPIISDVLADAAKLLPKNQVLAFSWTALRADDKSPQALVNLGRARSSAEFRASLRDFLVPQQNVVYADVEGNIGFIAPGLVPVRRADNPLQGLAPSPGWDARFDWQGFIPFEQLPQRVNPASGMIATANNKIIEPNDPHWIGTEWAPPFRVDRIREMLDGQARHDFASFARMQGDVRSRYLADVMPLIWDAPSIGAEEAAAIQALKKWNFEMTAQRSEPLIATAWLRELGRLIYQDELGEYFANLWGERPLFMINVLRDVQGQARWCDDQRTPEGETCAQMASKALGLALADLRARYGEDHARWRWGDAHLAISEHRPFSKQTWLAHIFEIATPVPGDTWTVNVGRISITDATRPFATRHGPSLRAIYDLADGENSRFVHSSGQSGNPFSPFYRDLNPVWASVQYLPMSTRPERYLEDAAGTLNLLPARPPAVPGKGVKRPSAS